MDRLSTLYTRIGLFKDLRSGAMLTTLQEASRSDSIVAIFRGLRGSSIGLYNGDLRVLRLPRSYVVMAILRASGASQPYAIMAIFGALGASSIGFDRVGGFPVFPGNLLFPGKWFPRIRTSGLYWHSQIHFNGPARYITPLLSFVVFVV